MKPFDCFSNPYTLNVAFSKLWSMQLNSLERLFKTAPVLQPS